MLVLRAQLGERAALVCLIERWQEPVWTYLRRRLPTDQIADDVAQDVWVAVLRNLADLQQPDRFVPWLFTIARRGVADGHRRRQRRREDLGTVEDVPIEDDHPTALASRETVDRLIRTLPRHERRVVRLFYLEDRSVTAIADELEIPAGTVKSRLARARTRMFTTATHEELS